MGKEIQKIKISFEIEVITKILLENISTTIKNLKPTFTALKYSL